VRKLMLSVGFAVRCEAMAVPRRQCASISWAAPLERAWPFNNKRMNHGRDEVRDRTKGLARIDLSVVWGEAEPSPHSGRQSRVKELLKNQKARSLTGEVSARQNLNGFGRVISIGRFSR